MDPQSLTIAEIVVGLPVAGPFDYFIPENLRGQVTVGKRVKVSFGQSVSVGYVVGLLPSSKFKNLKTIISVLDKAPAVTAKMLMLTQRMSEHYGCSWGEAIETSLPPGARKSNELQLSSTEFSESHLKDSFKNILIHDPKGDQWGKLVQEKIRAVLDEGSRVMILVAEDDLAEIILERIGVFPGKNIINFARSMKASEELGMWSEIYAGNADVVIGTRSSVFLPIPKLGLIVMLEESDPSFKQEQAPHYHAREVVLMRQEIEKCAVIFASRCPSLEIWHRSHQEKWEINSLIAKPTASVQVIDLGNYKPVQQTMLSFPSQSILQQAVQQKKKVLIFINQRGFSSMTRCQQCGHTLTCSRCNTILTYMYAKKKMVCRRCNTNQELPKLCPQCQGDYLRSTGTGIEKVESELARFYPQAWIGRYDKDSGKVPTFDVLVATQSILKKDVGGFDLVIVPNFDGMLHRMHFRSSQEAMALLTQLRFLAKEKIVIQSRMMDNEVLLAIKKDDPAVFYKNELKVRKELGLPPFKHMVVVQWRDENEEKVVAQTQKFFERLREKLPKSCEAIEPHPDLIPKLRDNYRYSIIIKGSKIDSILAAIKKALKGFNKQKSVMAVNVDY